MAFVPIYILIILFTIVVDFFAGIFMETSRGKKRKLFLVASLIANIGVLGIFKYYNFISDNLNIALKGMGLGNTVPHMSILLPIGLSFHTFRAMSYTIEIYRGKQIAERNFGIYALYVMFYPLLVAGPIERPQNLLHQFYEEHHFDYQRVTDGLKLMAWGLFKKVVVADRLAIVVDNVYNNLYEHTGLSLIIATVFFSFQIFCDFSGYSDMAIGAGQVMGFKLMENFHRPYHSKSISEFWRRWHISLSTWFRDYLYISLGGNRVAVPRWYFNLFFVFLVSGLWHGANWTYVIWGALHGSYIIFSLITKSFRKRLCEFIGLNRYQRINKGVQGITTFILVTGAWIFFRAQSVGDTLYIMEFSISGLKEEFSDLLHHVPWNLNLGVSGTQILICLGGIVLMEYIHIMQNKFGLREWLKKKPIYLRWGIYYTGFLMILFLGMFENRQFIYFQF
jgi:D-alanyl-lipoteichoic acid acyltransferase DltB (MBOAT superfamily)